MTTENIFEDQLISKKQILQLTGYSSTWLSRAVKQGNFPQPVNLSSRFKKWLKSDVDDWILGLKSQNSEQIAS